MRWIITREKECYPGTYFTRELQGKRFSVVSFFHIIVLVMFYHMNFGPDLELEKKPSR